MGEGGPCRRIVQRYDPAHPQPLHAGVPRARDCRQRNVPPHRRCTDGRREAAISFCGAPCAERLLRRVVRTPRYILYSSRSAAIGSTQTARRAGAKAANPDAASRHINGSARLGTSEGFTSNSNVETYRESANPPAIPHARPAKITTYISETTSRTTLDCLAPNAIRIPISFVRLSTE